MLETHYPALINYPTKLFQQPLSIQNAVLTSVDDPYTQLYCDHL